jgi:hypothetical protein
MYVLMNAKTKALFQSYYHKTEYAYKGHAQRAANKYLEKFGEKWIVIARDEYMAKYGNLTKKVRNLMTGEQMEISINTPASCDPSSETYWSM